MSNGPSNREIAYRATPMAVELRSGTSSRVIGGLAAVFGKESQPLGGFVEIVEPQAFLKSQNDGWPAVCRLGAMGDGDA